MNTVGVFRRWDQADVLQVLLDRLLAGILYLELMGREFVEHERFFVRDSLCRRYRLLVLLEIKMLEGKIEFRGMAKSRRELQF